MDWEHESLLDRRPAQFPLGLLPSLSQDVTTEALRALLEYGGQRSDELGVPVEHGGHGRFLMDPVGMLLGCRNTDGLLARSCWRSVAHPCSRAS